MNFLDYFKNCHAEILKDINDDERCHVLEDDALTYFYLNYNKASKEDQESAVKILKEISKLEFSRWCA